MIRLPLSGHETDTVHFRKEGRHLDLDWRDRFYDRSDDLWTLTMRRLIRPWTPQDDERLKAFAAHGASILKVAAALHRSKISIRERAKKLGCPFPTDREARKKWADKPNNVWRGY
jgi:hypothetical protein